MATTNNKVSYAKLNLKVNNEVNTFTFKDQTIEVLKYLPIEDKYDLVMITLQKSLEDDGMYNPIKMDMYFHLYLIYLYTNLSFTDKQRENEAKIYDALVSNGFLDTFLNTAFDRNEYNVLTTMIETLKNERLAYTTTAASVINKFINDLPKNAETAVKLMEKMDLDKFEQVQSLARTVGYNK